MAENNSTKRKLVSIICPVYNEAQAIPIFADRVKKVLEPYWGRYDFELIFTNNRSEDKSLNVILSLREKEPWIHVITLSRNFLYQASLLSGMENALGEAIICIDVDCEDPPEMIPQLLEGWEQGYDIVYGERVDRPENPIIKFGRKAFYRTAKLIADVDFVLDMAEFGLITRQVRDCIIDNKSTYPYIRADIAYVGFRRLNVPYKRQERSIGSTHYHIGHMFRDGIGGILSSSTFPLRLIYFLGFPTLLSDVGFLALWLMGYHITMEGIILINVIFVVFATIFISAYLARIYKNGVQRPLFIVDSNNTYLNRPVVKKNFGA